MGQGIKIKLPPPAFDQETFRYRVDGRKKENDPEHGIPDHRFYASERQIAGVHRGGGVKQDPIERIPVAPFQHPFLSDECACICSELFHGRMPAVFNMVKPISSSYREPLRR